MKKVFVVLARYCFILGDRFPKLEIVIESTFLPQNVVDCKSKQPHTRVINDHQIRSINFDIKGVCLGVFHFE